MTLSLLEVRRMKNHLKFGWSLALAWSALLFVGVQTRAAVPTEPAKEPAHPPAIVLWPNGAPGSESRKNEQETLAWREEPENNITFPVLFNIHNPSVVPFIPDAAKASGAAIIVAPGGGNMFLTIDREGYDLGKWLADHGVAAFVLKYRLSHDQAGYSPPYKEDDSFADAKRSMRLVRSRAADWGIDPKRIGFLGFSAGGQLAGMMSTQFDAGDAKSSDPIEKTSCRPDFNGFIYGGPYRSATFTDQMAPSFLLCAFNDPGNATAEANLFLKLKAANVQSELHIYSTGGHGFGVRNDRKLAEETWPARLYDWMGDIGVVKK
jgi:endo-1,4-beta-xylanase